MGLCADGGGAWVEAHAGHFAEEIAGAELGDGVVEGQVDGRVDGDVRGVGALVSRALLATFAAGACWPSSARKLGLLVLVETCARGEPRSTSTVAFEDVEGGRAVVAFADDDLAGLVGALDDGAGVEFEEGAGDALEDGQREEVFGFDGVDVGAVVLIGVARAGSGRRSSCW